MAKNITLGSLGKIIIEQPSEERPLTDAMDEYYTNYAWHTIEDRALPDLRDGLKPAQRRTLFGMKELGLRNTASTSKCAKVTGYICGTYHPHGDMVVYPTLFRMAQEWVMRYPLVIGQGNFGSIQGHTPAAQRYTECKLSRYGEALLDGVNDRIVPYIPNYDEKESEPTILPAAFPNLLANGTSGIAVAVATRICPHNLTELSNLIVSYIEKEGTLSTDEIMAIMPGPDFPTGGILRGQKGVRSYYETGKGSLVIDGVYAIEEDVKGNASIVISQVPYETSPKDIEHEIIELVQSEKLKGIKDVKDLSYGNKGKTIINLVVYLDKTANAQLVANQILKHTSLRKTYSVSITVTLKKKVLQAVPMLALVADFVDHRRIVFRNRFVAERDQHEKACPYSRWLYYGTDKH